MGTMKLIGRYALVGVAEFLIWIAVAFDYSARGALWVAERARKTARKL